MAKLHHQSCSLVTGALLIFTSLMAGCTSEPEKTAIPPLSVQLQTLKPVTLISSSEYVGTLQARNRVNLAARVSGRISKIHIKEGDRVIAGQPIIELEPTQEQENVNAAASEVNVAQSNLNATEAEYRQSQTDVQAAIANIAQSQANIKNREAELKSQEADLQRAEANLDLAEKNYERAAFLVREGAQAQQSLDDESRNIRTAKADLEASQKRRDAAIANVQAAKESLNIAIQNKAAAEQRVDSAAARVNSQKAVVNRAQAQLGSTNQNLAFQTIRAPIDGIVGSFDQHKVGDFINAGDQLTTITNNQILDLNINIPMENEARLRAGLAVESIRRDGSIEAKGQITYVAPLTDQNTQSVQTKVTFNNNGSLRDRQYVKVRVIWEEKPGVLIPTTAVTSIGAQKFVFVARENQSTEGEETTQTSLVVRQQPIQVGTIQGQAYQVISGVQAGDKIAISRILDLRDGTPITESEQTVSQK